MTERNSDRSSRAEREAVARTGAPPAGDPPASRRRLRGLGLPCLLLVLPAILAAPGCTRDAGSAPAPPRPPAAEPPPAPGAPALPARLPAIELRIGGRYHLRAEVACTDAERERGLMGRRDLGEDEGMLFVYRDDGFRHFWMRNTPLPLSIAFIARDGRITQISNLEPFDEASVSSREAVPYALEVHRGWFRAHGIREGDRVEGLDRAPPASD